MLRQKTPLRRKTPLLRKTPLRASTKATAPKKRKPRKTLEQKTKKELVKPADEWFSRYIRLRDSEYVNGEWVGECITCQRPLVVLSREGKWNAAAQNGHYIGRGNFRLRYDEYDCNLQCAHCNAWLDKIDMLERYRKGLDLKYGKGTAARLKRESKLDGTMKFQSRESLLQIIADSKTYIEYTLKNC